MQDKDYLIYFAYTIEEDMQGSIFDRKTLTGSHFPAFTSIQSTWAAFNKFWNMLHTKKSISKYGCFELVLHDSAYGQNRELKNQYEETLKSIRFVVNRVSSFDSWKYIMVKTIPHEVFDHFDKQDFFEKIKSHINYTYQFLTGIGFEVKLEQYIA